MASLSRENLLEPERALHALYCDEVQNFTLVIDFPTILAESRKYALSLVASTQTLAGLPAAAAKAIFGNCATIAAFCVRGEDTQALGREFGVAGDETRRTVDQMTDMIVSAS